MQNMALKRWRPSKKRNAIYNVSGWLLKDILILDVFPYHDFLKSFAYFLLFRRKKLMESIREKYLETSKLKLLKHIEFNLYVNASSMEEYADISTLKLRMVRVVKRMAHDAKKNTSPVKKRSKNTVEWSVWINNIIGESDVTCLLNISAKQFFFLSSCSKKYCWACSEWNNLY